MKQLFKGQTVLITGASAGFGAAIATVFAQAGANLILIARRQAKLKELEHRLRCENGVDIMSLCLDVANFDDVAKQLNALSETFFNPDILINNAGMVRGMNTVWDTPSHDWNEMIDINIKGILNICSQIIPRLLKRHSGHIINVGSVSGHDTYSGGGVYCATKYAVKAITDTLRKELIASPIRVSMISPGLAKTEFSHVRFNGDAEKAKAPYLGIEALSASDIAEIVLFMASRPPHVNIADVIVYPVHQASVSMVHRQS